ncbi:MAG TPA: 2-oxo acid dehydrogenase subunit E2 [Trueperaceae bacterium]|nr:2-oxo acid dehydrogenase subunit E2 [Trueperaceae bacterium]
MPTEVKLPDIGEGIEKGTVVGVLVKVGDTVAKDQPLVELETDKAVVEVPSSASGVVSKINVTENQEARVGSVLVVVDEEASEPAAAAGGVSAAASAAASAPASEPAPTAPQDAAPSASVAPASTPSAAAVPAQAAPQASEPRQQAAPGAQPQPGPALGAAANEAGGGTVPAAPSVRRLARELGVDIRAVPGSGVLGRISAADVRAYADGVASGSAVAGPRAAVPAGSAPAAAQVAAPLPDFSRWGETERTPMSGVRKATVRSMTNAWSSVPMVTQFDKADITELEVVRKRYQPKAEALGAKLTPTAILLKVVAGALRRFPDFNASIDLATQEIVHKRYVNVGVAVDTDAGLLVPVVKNADRKNMLELAVELGELAVKARNRKLTPDEMQGGNFSISNLGGIGGYAFTPIVNPPDVAILGVSRSSMEPVWNPDAGQFEPRLMLPLSLTYDHRLIDGAAAARFLRWVCTALEDPFIIALEG